MIKGDRLKIRAEVCAWGQPIKLDAGPLQRKGKKEKTREEENGRRREVGRGKKQ